MKKLFFAFLIALITCSCDSYSMTSQVEIKKIINDDFLLQYSSGIYLAKLSDIIDGSYKSRPLLSKEILNVSAFTYSSESKTMYISGTNRIYLDPHIYKYSFDDSAFNVEPLFKGRMPSISQDGQMLAYINPSNEIAVYDTANKEYILYISNINIYASPVFSKKILYYMNSEGYLCSYNIDDKNIKVIGEKGLTPISVSPDGKFLLCFWNKNNEKIFLSYNILDNTFQKIIKSSIYFRPLFPMAIWSKGSNGILFSRLTVTSHFFPMEKYNLYYMPSSGKPIFLKKGISFLCGFPYIK